MKKGITAWCCACVALFLVSAAAMAGDVNLSVAASLKEAMNDLTSAYAKQHPGVTFRKNYGASGALAKQIENGAPADLFISANADWMDYLKERKLVDPSTIGTFAGNTLVFAGATGTKAAGMQDLPALSRVAIGSPKSVPAGEYALEAMKRSGIAQRMERKLVMAKDVRDALTYAERGEVDGAFVYRTDELLAKHVRVLFTVPAALHPPVVYPMGLTVAGSRRGDVTAFFRFLRSAAAKKILEKYGFAVQ